MFNRSAKKITLVGYFGTNLTWFNSVRSKCVCKRTVNFRRYKNYRWYFGLHQTYKNVSVAFLLLLTSKKRLTLWMILAFSKFSMHSTLGHLLFNASVLWIQMYQVVLYQQWFYIRLFYSWSRCEARGPTLASSFHTKIRYSKKCQNSGYSNWQFWG